MKFSNEGLTVWYETEDASMSTKTGIVAQSLSLTIGVYPENPSNRVTVRYRVDGGLIRTISAILAQSNPTQKIQYFRASWPHTLRGDKVEYLVIFTCAGRQVPDTTIANTFPSSFQLPQQGSTFVADLNQLGNSMAPTKAVSQVTSFPVSLDFLCTVRAQLNRQPEIIGETPEGLKVNWFLQGGEAIGPKLNAKICPQGGDWMTIRPDGVGILGIRATLETPEGALIYTTYSGVFDLGKKGYQSFLNHQWPHAPPLRSTPRFLTKHSRYKWLNRLQCIGIGEVRMSDLLVIYDLYAL